MEIHRKGPKMKLRQYSLIFIFSFLSVFLFSVMGASPTATNTPKATPNPIEQAINAFVQQNLKKNYDELFPPRTKVDKVVISDDRVEVHFSPAIGYYPLRPKSLWEIRGMLRPVVEQIKPGATIDLYIKDRPLEDYIPPVFRKREPLSQTAPEPAAPPWVRNATNPAPKPSAGLFGRHIVLWGSHGWFYDATTDLRWEWQRPRMFTIVEDLLPTSFMLPFILPMLERAGAVTCYVRERDPQIHEVLVDDGDGESLPDNGTFQVSPASLWKKDDGPGFQNGNAPFADDFNPHEKGNHHIAITALQKTASSQWIPHIPVTDRYCVYVSYNMDDSRAPDALYTVYHLGGKTDFLVNQKMGGNTWVYLGNFLFAEGTNPEKGSVVLSNKSSVSGATVSADCVKFGGGMGNIIREGRTSGYPRYCEAGRYWLQYDGVKPELVYKMGFKGGMDGPDYTEDYVSRAEFANYLKGAPFGPSPDRNFPGLGVPVDLAFGFHTDAGIKEGIVGTLSIYTEKDEEKKITFPDGTSRLDDNRMLTDLIQTQIVNDIREQYSSTWTRRQLRNANYSESRRGNMPSSLLELFSHQNFHDMKYGLDPRFRFHVSRSIYKAMLRFIAFKNGYEPVVAPLAPTHFSVVRKSETEALLSWRPQRDPLEPSAVPGGYIVSVREGADETAADFDSGVLVSKPPYIAQNLSPEKVYSFRVTAYNKGGESFPSEVLCVKTGKDSEKEKRALIVQAFDRLAPPSMIIKEGHSGFDRIDKGVGYMANFGLTGDTWDFDPESKFRTNDAPGHGASHGNLETRLELGNTFDFAIRHGAAMAASGWNFDSISDETLRDEIFELEPYRLVDWLLGEERTTPPPRGLPEEGKPDKMKTNFKTLTFRDQKMITNYLTSGGALFLSGAYVATDLAGVDTATDEDKKFLTDVLKIYWTTNNGSKTNNVFAAPEGPFKGIPPFHISSGTGEDGVYGVELPDSLKPAVKPKDVKKFETSETVLRYEDHRWSAGIAMKKPACVCVFGFPFECIVGGENRSQVMKTVLDYLFQP